MHQDIRCTPTSLKVTDELLEHVSAQGIVLAFDKRKDHRWISDINDFEIQVGWKSLKSFEDLNEPLTDLAKQICVLVDSYAQQSDGQRLQDSWQTLQSGQQQQQFRPITSSTCDTRTSQQGARPARR